MQIYVDPRTYPTLMSFSRSAHVFPWNSLRSFNTQFWVIGRGGNYLHNKKHNNNLHFDICPHNGIVGKSLTHLLFLALNLDDSWHHDNGMENLHGY